MSTYYLSLKNTTAVQQHVFLFTAPPQIGQVADRNIFTNTWVDKYLDPNESLSVSTELNFYAFAGPSLDDQGRTKVTQGVYTNPVTLGTSGGDPGSTFKTLWDTNKQHFGWDSRAQPPTASAGCFEIDTDTNFMVSDNLLIGMAMDPPSGGDGPVPVACFSAQPGMRYNIGPVVRFYVAVGDMAIGDIVDFQSVSATAGIWDFSPTGPGNGFKHGSLQYDSHGKWTQTVYDNNTPRLTDLNDGLPPWVEAVVRLSIPIVQSAVRQAVILAIQNAITGLRYSYGPITFSSDGKSVSVSYRILQAALDASNTPSGSDIQVTLDAKNEVLTINFLAHEFGQTQLVGDADQNLTRAIKVNIAKTAGVPAGEAVTVF